MACSWYRYLWPPIYLAPASRAGVRERAPLKLKGGLVAALPAAEDGASTRERIRDGEACRIGLTMSGELGPGTTSSGDLLKTDTESGGVEDGGVV